MQKKEKQFRLVLGLADESDLDSILYILLESDIWAPVRMTKEELKEEYDFHSLPEHFDYQPILLIGSYRKDVLFHFIEKIRHEDLNIFISSIF